MDQRVPKVSLLVIRSADIHQAVRFYQSLGMEFELHSHGSGPEHYASEECGFVFEIYPEKPGIASTGVRIGLRVGSVDDSITCLAELKVEILSPPADSPWGRRAVVRDFDGHTVELSES